MANEKVKSYFKDYPGSNECFETADGILFHQEGDANWHQTGTLKSKAPVKKHYRNAAPVADLAASTVTTSAATASESGNDTGEDALIGEDDTQPDAGIEQPKVEPVIKKAPAKKSKS